MRLQDILISENATVKQAIEQLEKIRCKVIYVVKEKKLLASISDGDVRRYSLKSGNVEEDLSCIANYNPHFFNEFEKDKWKQEFQQSELYSIPITNLNQEIIGITFRDGRYLREREKMDIPVVMMAGGKGTRLYPYTKILPKALIPIGDIPISEYIINHFNESGCSNFFILINHKGGMIQSYFNNIEKPYSLQYFEEIKPLGTGGGLSLLKSNIKEDFILTNCDIFVDADFTTIYKMHKKKDNLITIVLSQYTTVIPYGVISIDDANNYLELKEKPGYQYLINTGVYIVNSKIIEESIENEIINFPDMIEKYRQRGERIGCYVVNESAYMDMGQFEELEKMKTKLNIK